MAQYITEKFVDYFPEGKFTGLSQEAHDKLRSLEKHNKFSEYVFANYDQLLRFKPHIQTLASEAYVMFGVNRTTDWLNQKSTEDIKTHLSEAARRDVPEVMKQFKLRKGEIKRRRHLKIQEGSRAREVAEAKRLKEKELTTDEIIYYGHWQTQYNRWMSI